MMRSMLLVAVCWASVVAAQCQSYANCSLNGQCIDGVCQCEAAWYGPQCDMLVRRPADLTAGFHSPHNGGKTSSWGGSVLRDENGTYHMYSSVMALECGINYWEPNSMVVHATAQAPAGPYVQKSTIELPFAHEPNVVRGPNGEYVIYMLLRNPNGFILYNCTGPNITEATGDGEGVSYGRGATTGDCPVPPARSTYMVWSDYPDGPWSDPVLVLKPWNGSMWNNCPAEIDTNLAMAIRADGSAVGIWRKCTNNATGPCEAGCCTFPRMLTASNWKDPTTYEANSDTVLFPDMKPFGAEDPFVWLDETDPNGIHVIFHDEQGATRSSANGTHAYSPDNGATWVYGSNLAYNNSVETVGGTTMLYARREHPHLVFNEHGQPVVITNGVQELDASMNCTADPQCSRSYTLAQPLGQ
ncbi:hypothetical protein DIPPA_16830 [Diplonema papillatum]|nr:hypothetical protein DIPPA_16830 [Diplonema papillatum]